MLIVGVSYTDAHAGLGTHTWTLGSEDPNLGPGLCLRQGILSLNECRSIETGQALCMAGSPKSGPRTAIQCRDISIGGSVLPQSK